MKTATSLVVSILSVSVLAGCVSPDARMRAIQADNSRLNQDIRSKTRMIEELAAEKSRLAMELEYSSRRAEVLMKERNARRDDETALRKGVREFTEQMQASLQTYYKRTEIVDYLGSELIPRASDDSQKNVMLVDLGNPILQKGTIIGGRAWVTGPTRLCYCLLRQEPVGRKYRVVTVTPEVVSEVAGTQNWIFDMPMAVRKGDLIGVYVPGSVSIPYDDVDTGEVCAFSGKAEANSVITIIPGNTRSKRAYSFGVIGYFDSPVTSSASAPPLPDPPTASGGK
ncbi:MAG: hypothetical protein WCL44_13365 [bacterium]